MNALLALSRMIDAFTERLGRGLTWLVLLVTLVSAFNASMRYAISYSSNAWIEIQWYLFSALFMLGGGYTLLRNEHVRIDVVSSHLSARARAWIDVLGLLLFVGPLVWLFVTLGIPFVRDAWVTGEMSSNTGGLIRWPVKALVPLGFALLGVQALSELIKRVGFLAGSCPDPNARADHSAEEELAREIAAQAGETTR